MALKAVNDKTTMELLEDPELFVIDTGATYYSTRKQQDFIPEPVVLESEVEIGWAVRPLLRCCLVL